MSQGQIHAGSLQDSSSRDFTLTLWGKDAIFLVCFHFGPSKHLRNTNDSDVLDVSTCEKVEHTQALLGEAGQSQLWTKPVQVRG